MSQQEQINLNISLDKTTELVCDECGNPAFQEVVLLRKASRFITGTSQDAMVPIPVFACSKCGQELEQQLADAIAVAQRLNKENKTLKLTNDSLTAENTSLKNDFASAVDRVRYLDGQVKMLESQKKASTQFNDNDKNY